MFCSSDGKFRYGNGPWLFKELDFGIDMSTRGNIQNLYHLAVSCILAHQIETSLFLNWSQGYKKVFMLTSVETEISTAHK